MLKVADTAGDAVAAIYAVAVDDILTAVARRTAATLHRRRSGRVGANQRRRLRSDVARIIRAAHTDAARTLAVELGAAADEGHRYALTRLHDLGVVPADTAVRPPRTERAVRYLHGATGAIVEQADRAYRQAVDAGAGGADRVLADFADRGVRGRDSTGRPWELEGYARMVAVNETRDAATFAALTLWVRSKASGLVRVPHVDSPCPLCQPWEGRTLSIAGRDPGHPTLADAVAAGLRHPNCRHHLVPVLTADDPVEDLSTRAAQPRGTAGEDRDLRTHAARNVRRWRRREIVAVDPAVRARARRYRTRWLNVR